ncbi:hypothetical protein AB1Y20_004251 [Prymnesium parvum]|uniref:Uncharacterized protein n=1 Tax=Prymnesium parvum TaxID=97485 RepID=A0AB34J9R4_PRYPA
MGLEEVAVEDAKGWGGATAVASGEAEAAAALERPVPLEEELATGEGGMALAVMETVAEKRADKVGGRRATAIAEKVAVAKEVETLAMARKGDRAAGASVAARGAAMGKAAAAKGEITEQVVALLAAVAEMSEDGVVGCRAAAVVTWERVELEAEAAGMVVSVVMGELWVVALVRASQATQDGLAMEVEQEEGAVAKRNNPNERTASLLAEHMASISVEWAILSSPPLSLSRIDSIAPRKLVVGLKVAKFDSEIEGGVVLLECWVAERVVHLGCPLLRAEETLVLLD